MFMTNLKNLFQFLLLIGLTLFLLACSKLTQTNFEKIKNDMTMKDVISILGEPSSSESITIAGISGTSAVWKDKNIEIDIQFLNDRVTVKSFNKVSGSPTQNKPN